MTYQYGNVVSEVQGQWPRFFHHQVIHLHEFSKVARVPRENTVNVIDTPRLQKDFFENCCHGLVFSINRHHRRWEEYGRSRTWCWALNTTQFQFLIRKWLISYNNLSKYSIIMNSQADYLYWYYIVMIPTNVLNIGVFCLEGQIRPINRTPVNSVKCLKVRISRAVKQECRSTVLRCFDVEWI